MGNLFSMALAIFGRQLLCCRPFLVMENALQELLAVVPTVRNTQMKKQNKTDVFVWVALAYVIILFDVRFYLVTFSVGLCLRLAELKFEKFPFYFYRKNVTLYIDTRPSDKPILVNSISLSGSVKNSAIQNQR